MQYKAWTLFNFESNLLTKFFFQKWTFLLQSIFYHKSYQTNFHMLIHNF